MAEVTFSSSSITLLGICQKRPPLKYRSAFACEVYSSRYSVLLSVLRKTHASNTFAVSFIALPRCRTNGFSRARFCERRLEPLVQRPARTE
jgi:hypothetical protein